MFIHFTVFAQAYANRGDLWENSRADWADWAHMCFALANQNSALDESAHAFHFIYFIIAFVWKDVPANRVSSFKSYIEFQKNTIEISFLQNTTTKTLRKTIQF